MLWADGRLAEDDSASARALDRAAGWVGEISPETVTVFQEEDARWQFQNGNAAFHAQLAVCVWAGDRRRTARSATGLA